MAGDGEDRAVQEPVSGMWRSQDMAQLSFHFNRDSVHEDLLRLGKLGCCQFRNENQGIPNHPDQKFRTAHKLNVNGLRAAETLERHCRFFRDQLKQWNHLSEDIRASAATAATQPRGMTGTNFTGELVLDDVLSPEGRKIDTHAEDLRTYNEKFARMTQEFAEWHTRVELLGHRMIEALCKDGMPDGQYVMAGTIAKEKYQMFRRLVARRSKGKVQMEPGALDTSMPTTEHELNLPDSHTIGVDAGTAQDLLFDVFYSAGGNKPNLIRFVCWTSSREAHHRAFQVATSQEAKIVVCRKVQVKQAGGSGSVLVDFNMSAGTGTLDWKTGECRVPSDANDLQKCKVSAKEKLKEIAQTMKQTRKSIAKELGVVNNCLTAWEQMACVHREVSYTHGLLAEGTDKFTGTAWCPKARWTEVQQKLQPSGAGPATTNVFYTRVSTSQLKERPTYMEENKFTSAFQGIVWGMGAPNYKEIDPTCFTIITFPWLFGVMYGDIGHGLIITFFAAILCLKEKSIAQAIGNNDTVLMIFNARYLLLLMGLFATYVGFLYNDCFALMFEYSPSRYSWPDNWEKLGHGKNGLTTVDPVCTRDGGFCATHTSGAGDDFQNPTPFGFDVAWMETSNKIDVYNSFKEKNAVILGVCQMLLGICLKCMNHVYRVSAPTNDAKSIKHIFFGFIPEFLFLSCTFGYMCFIIIYKWTHAPPQNNTNLAPNLLESMTNFFLAPGGDPSPSMKSIDGQPPGALYDGQVEVQTILLLISLVCVLLMLLPIPIIEYCDLKEQHKKWAEQHPENNGTEMQETQALLDKGDKGNAAEKESPHKPVEIGEAMQEVVIRQVIHTIEFVLGAVSNTASYLRLWALSLAHAQLAEVFWTFTFMLPFGVGAEQGLGVGSVVMYFAFGLWFSVTIGILVCMEALSAFLHTLRLHWVEFENKFFGPAQTGGGHAFIPMCFNDKLKENQLDAIDWEAMAKIEA